MNSATMTDQEILAALVRASVDAGLPERAVRSAVRCYEQPQRVYHGLQHLVKLYRRVLDLGLVLHRSQTLALLFHDAVYVPGAQGNEEASAKLFSRCATSRSSRVSHEATANAAQIILDTERHVATIPESSLVLDLDLSGLGQDEAAFDQDSREVFEELHMPDLGWNEYCVRRAAFFAGLLVRRGGRVYETEVFAPLEGQAQKNLARTQPVAQQRSSSLHTTPRA